PNMPTVIAQRAKGSRGVFWNGFCGGARMDLSGICFVPSAANLHRLACTATRKKMVQRTRSDSERTDKNGMLRLVIGTAPTFIRACVAASRKKLHAIAIAMACPTLILSRADRRKIIIGTA